MKFHKYQHIERLGTVAVEGILDGEVYIFPKLDGSNTSIYLNDSGEVEIGSRNRVVTLEHDNVGVYAMLKNDERFKNYFEIHPNHRLFGEWLVRHTIRDYRDDAWRKVYIFDVMKTDENGNEKYLKYEEYLEDLYLAGIRIIPCISKLENPTVEEVESWLDKCDFLMKDGKPGEGIVLKNYDFVNKFGNVVWAKIVRKEIKASQTKHKPVLNSTDVIENQIVENFLTKEFVDKEKAKIEVENGGWQSKLIPKLFGVIWHTFITEETFNAVKKFHNPKIDFALLNRLVVKKTKQFEPEIFEDIENDKNSV